MSQYALSVTLATFLRARPPPTKIRVTLSIKTFARGSSFPHSRGFDWLVRHFKKHGEREKKLECNGIMSCTRNERDLAAENSNFPSFQHIGISPSPPLPPSPSPFSPLAPFTLRTFLVRPLCDISLSLSYRDLKVQASRSPDTVILYTQRHDASGRKENDNLEPRAVIVRELNFDSPTTFCYISAQRRELHCRPSPRKKFDHVAIR